MKKQADNKFNNFFDSFPAEEIINILVDIDNKIKSLHTFSSKDFMYFNKLLKQYYSYIKDISVANNIISVFISKNLHSIKEEVNIKNQRQINVLNNINKNQEKIIGLLMHIYSSFDMLVVPENNFKQNLITLKYILTNLKLHLNYVNLIDNEKLKKSIAVIENTVSEIYTQIEKIKTGADNILKDILFLKNEVCSNKQRENVQLKDELTNTTYKLNKLILNNFINENFVNDMNNSTQKCFTYMGEVITNIQYHDIIRQKMEHVQSSQNFLKKELSFIAEDKSADNNDRLNLIIKIPEITDIQVAQLLYTNKDYQVSIEKITNQLIEVGNEMKFLNSIYIGINDNTINFKEELVNKIEDLQTDLSKYYSKLTLCYNIASDKSIELNKKYTDLKKEYNTLFLSEKKLRKEVENFESLLKENSGKIFEKELLRRLKDLFFNIQTNSNSIKTHLNSITHDINTLENTIEKFKPEENINLKHDTLKILIDKIEEIKNKSQEYSKLSKTIFSDITQSLKRIEYYTYFKKTVEDIEHLLNKINSMINYDALREILVENKEYLEKIETFYTMKSEREIHNKVLGLENGNDIDEREKSHYDNLDNNDIELF
jgi:hypothetical protein